MLLQVVDLLRLERADLRKGMDVELRHDADRYAGADAVE